jgi:hypothetical protein
MIEKLKKKWGVNNLNLILILCTFAIGGSFCGFLGRKILGLFEISNGFLFGVLYVIVMTIIWPACVLIISVPLGQFKFFKNYIQKILQRFKR